VGEQINGSIIKGYYTFVGDTKGANVSITNNSDFTDFGSDYGVSGGTQILVFNGNGSRYHGIGSNLFGNPATNGTAIYIGNTTTNTVILEGGRWNNGATTSNGLFINSTTDKVYISDGTILGGTSNALNINGGNVFLSASTLTSAAAAIGGGGANSKVVDLCGNSYTGTILAAANLLFTPCLTATYATAVPFVGATGTGACATITTQTGNIFNGSLKCTGTTGASTIVLSPGITAQNGWTCTAVDLTTNADTPLQTANAATTCTLGAAAIAQNDVIAFSLQQY
jgi:hypothetical protein